MIPQSDWRKTVDNSVYTIPAAADLAGIEYNQFLRIINNKQIPRLKRFLKIQELMAMFEQKKKIQFHPSFGWATPEQIEKLNELPMGYERNYLLATIAKQTKDKGKQK